MGNDYKEMTRILVLRAEAIKGMAAIAEYMTESKDINKEAVDALHTLQDWLFGNE